MRNLIINYRPPRIAQLFILIAAILHWFTPMSYFTIYSNYTLGSILGLAGFIIMMWGWWLFKKFDAAICPTAKTDRLVDTSLYKLSRNPMYLGVVSIMFAIAIFVGTLPFYLASVIYFIVLNNVFIPYEENKLVETFGEKYLFYKNNVRRWI